MADKKEAKKDDAAAGGEKAEKKVGGKREEKQASRWTKDLCMKFAKRFTSEHEFAAGAPSAYKAAMARGFMADCTKHMTAPKAGKKKSA
jgi:hypothetical protein